MTASRHGSTAYWGGGQAGVQAPRAVMFAVVAVTALLILAQFALALETMLMLDVALPGRGGESIAGLVAFMIVTIGLLLGGVALRQRLLRQAGRATAYRAARATAFYRLGPGVSDRASIADGRDMDLVRVALAGGGVAALLDVMSLPLHVAILLLLGWPMAIALLVGGAICIALLLFGRIAIAGRIDAADQARRARDGQLDGNTRLQGLLHQLGILEPMRVREQYAELAALDPAEQLDRAAWRSRLAVTSGVAVTLVVIGAIAVWRATFDRAGQGTIAASVLISAFALWPVREAAARQVELLRGRDAWRRMTDTLLLAPAEDQPLPLPKPGQSLTVEGVAIAAAGERRVVLQGVNFTMNAGDIAVVVGPADSGKSMLLRALAGLAPNAVGNVRLDGATLAQYGETGRARHIGFMPQGTELLPGTISQNIAGFTEDMEPDAVVRAAQVTGAHEVIVRLPQGYDTLVGGAGCSLSQSVRQRISLASAFFGDPFLLLLDTPDSFQDRFGRAALAQALEAAKARGAIVLVVGESNAVIEPANLAMVLRKGGVADFGPKDEVRQRMQVRERIKADAKPAAVAEASAE